MMAGEQEMNVTFSLTRRPFEDAGQQDSAGNYDFYYAGVLYDFDFGTVIYTVRQYEDTPQAAQVLSCQYGNKPSVMLQAIPEDPQFQAIVEYMTRQGIRELSVLTRKGYEKVVAD